MILHYFDCRGLAETSRYLLALAETPYTDRRLPLAFGTPGDLSTVDRAAFDAAQPAGEFVAGMDKVPILELEEGGHCIAQSKSIERFLAARTGMLGNTAVEAAQIDAVAEHVRDIKQAYQKVRSIDGEEAKQKAMDGWFDETLPAHSAKLDAALPVCVASCVGVTLAHVAIYVFYTQYVDRAADARQALAGCPQLARIVDYVQGQPAVEKWEAERPRTDF